MWFAISAHAAPPPQPVSVVDLDKPGALEQLKRERPAHYAKVIAEMDRVRAVPKAEPASPSTPLRFDPSAPDPTRRQVQTSDPAKTPGSLTVDNVVYSFTILYTTDRAKMVPTK